MRIILDAGHGGSDSGATNKGYKEKDITLNLALKIGALLNNHEIIYTRKNDKYISLNERCNISNKANADLFISIHVNSATNKNAKGIETFAYSTKSKGHEVAQRVQRNLIEVTKATDRGVKTSDFKVLRSTKAPAILIEVGFISNVEELEKLINDTYQFKLCDAIARAINNK
jgi:N-acetylmuramoyl-L-alanine amidase